MLVDDLSDGTRIGRFVILRDADGRRHAVSAASVSAICEDEAGVILLLPGGRLIRLEQRLEAVMAWLDFRPTWN